MKKLGFFIMLFLIILTILVVGKIEPEEKVVSKTDPIQSLLNSSDNGGTMIIPKGTYDINSKLIINRDNVTIDGSGSTLLCKSKITCLSLTGKNLILKNFKVNGNEIAKIGIQIEEGSSDVTLNNIEVFNIKDLKKSNWVYGINISASGCKNITIDGCYIHDIATLPNGITGDSKGMDKGIMIGETSSKFTESSQYINILNCKFERVGSLEDGSAIAIYGFKANSEDMNTCNFHVTIKNNYFNYCHKSFIKIMPCSYVSIENNDFVNPYNSVKESMFSAISVYGSHCEIINNKVHGGYSILGIELSVSGEDDTTLQDVNIKGNNMVFKKSDNKIKNTVTKGIGLLGIGDISNIDIQDNTISGQMYGIVQSNNKVKNLNFKNNNILNALKDFIQFKS
ncbi:MAG: right-handed parallel beta-helix repeat-containing protein [Clostridiaceae bacterium]|nr:right-handed parallel beta-helix repeat-containing protein [Clostridiaceae bacterium]